MEKVRVYELAKELNTTSKRLMEKLAEINIVVKNHMSLLEEHELEALYKHIGIIRHDEKKEEGEEKKPASVTPALPRQELKKDAKSAPRIIRTTEIIIRGKDGGKEASRDDYRRNDVRGDRSDRKNEYIKPSDANSGLLSGFVRRSRTDYPEYMVNIKATQKQDHKKQSGEAKTKEGGTSAVQGPGKMPPAAQAPAKVETREPALKDAAPEVPAAHPASAAPARKDVAKEQQPAGKDAVVVAKDGKKDGIIHEQAATKPKETGDAAGMSASSQPDISPKGTASAKGVEVKAIEVKVSDARMTDGKTIETRIAGKPAAEKDMAVSAKPQEAKPKEGKQQDARAQQAKPQEIRTPQAKAHEARPQQGKMHEARPHDAAARSDRQHGGKPQTAAKPQVEKPRGQGGGRPDRLQRQGAGKPQGGQGHRPAGKVLEIPKPELTAIQKEEMSSQRGEGRRDYAAKNLDKDLKREQKKEVPKAQQGKPSKKIKPTKIGLAEKKGLSEILSEDFLLGEFYEDANLTRKRTGKPKKEKEQAQKAILHKAVLTSIKIPETVTVKDLAEALKKTSSEIIKKLMGYGIMATLNKEIDFDTATVIAEEYGVKTEKEVVVNEEDILFDDSENDNPADLVPRPPVVVVMGHVDHGKTSLLDAIRSTNVIESEAGGITQHIGAYTVEINGRNITFLDTPGHEAFTAMRARGAQVTDIAILVVAADDGVMPQTVEAINHAKAANVSIIVAINKIDKPGANPDKVRQDLMKYGLVSEEWGGDVICVNVSAKKRENIDQLLEMVLLTADILELKANPRRQAKGTVIEAKLDKNRGPLATVLVQRGTLNVGDSVVTGTTFGRIRAMIDDKGKQVKTAGPSMPVEILGFPEVPEAGELFYVVDDEKTAKALVEKRKLKQKEQMMNTAPKVSLDDLFKQIQEGSVKELNVIVKADVQGSVEAVEQSLAKLSNEKVRVRVIHGGVGAITESDVSLADVSNAIIIGFNVRPGANVAEAAKNAGVDIRLYSVIYDAIEDVEAAMKGMLEPTFREVVLGHTEVRQIFKVSGVGTVAGCYVLDGKICRNNDVRIIRDNIVIHEGKLASLKRFKDDVREVQQGFECGLSIEKFNDIREQDIIEAFMLEEVKQ